MLPGSSRLLLLALLVRRLRACWLSSASLHAFGRILDSTHDVLIARAAADVAFELMANLFFAWIGTILEQLVRGHDHARSAEAALHAVFLPKAFLYWLQNAFRGHPIDRLA